MELAFLSASKILDLIKSGTTSAEDVYRYFQGRIQKYNPRINAFTPNQKLSEPSFSDAAGKGPVPVPIALKDNICHQSELTSCGSKILENFHATYDATVVAQLKSRGLPIAGNGNMDEFAFGSSCETSFYGPTKNPWNIECVPGGSSGGSAAAVAAGLVPWALGSDTGGSIRQPASFCGVVGLKPTYGRVSRYGLIAFASSLDQIGPITRTVGDAALLLEIISGFDAKDSTSVNVEVPRYTELSKGDIKGMRIGLPQEYFSEKSDPAVSEALDAAIEIYRSLGAEIIDSISLPHTKYALSTYYIIAPSEASSNLARFDGVKYGFRKQKADSLMDMYLGTRSEGFGDEAKRRILLGTFTLSHGYYDAYYLKALKVRTLIQKDLNAAFEKCDCLLTPTSPTVAFPMGEKSENPLEMYKADIFTIPANLSGIPAISIPCGFSRSKLPIGLQLMGRAFDEQTILKAARAFEAATDFHLKYPQLDEGQA